MPKRLIKFMPTPRAFVALVVWALTAVVIWYCFFFITPSIEPRIAPILSDQRAYVAADGRTVGSVCWKWNWTKVRYADPIVSSWWIVVDGTTVSYPAITQRRRNGETLTQIKPAPLGPGSNILCSTIPAELDNVPGLIIKGAVNYMPPHGLWTIWQDLPEVKVPDLPPELRNRTSLIFTPSWALSPTMTAFIHPMPVKNWRF